MRHRLVACAASLVILGALPACGGSVAPSAKPSEGSQAEAGPEPSVEPSVDGGSGDVEVQDAGVRDAPTGPLAAECDGVTGLTGQSVLDAIVQPPMGTFSRWVYPAGPPSNDDPTPLTVSAQYGGGAVLCTPAMQTSGPNPGTQPASVGVTVQVSFRTADGLFNDTFPATFTEGGNFSGTFPVANLQGSYKAIAEGDAAGSATPVTFFGVLDGSTASFSGGVVHGQPFGGFGF